MRSSLLNSFITYAGVAVSGIVLCCFLHYLGNQIPYDLAKQRFNTAYKEGNLPDSTEFIPLSREFSPIENLRGKAPWDDCEISQTVLGGARNEAKNLIVDAVMIKIAHPPKSLDRIDPCQKLKKMTVEDAEPRLLWIKSQYWWGTKAVYAIALRYFSVFEIREFIKTAVYFAYLLLAILLLQLSPRAFLILSPLIVFGFFFSGIRYLSIVTGLNYLWSVLSAVILTVLIAKHASPRVLNVFCFIAGMASNYLWLFDGHTVLIMPLIAVITYFGYGPHLRTSERTKQALSCVLFYFIGFYACYTLGILTKMIAYEWILHDPLYAEYLKEKRQPLESLLLGPIVGLPSRVGAGFLTSPVELLSILKGVYVLVLRVLDFFYSFFTIGLGKHYTIAKVLSVLTALAFAGATSFAIAKALKGHSGIFYDVLFVAGLIAFITLQLLVPNDNIVRVGRFLFAPYALCWSCLILVVMDRRSRQEISPGATAAWADREFTGR